MKLSKNNMTSKLLYTLFFGRIRKNGILFEKLSLMRRLFLEHSMTQKDAYFTF